MATQCYVLLLLVIFCSSLVAATPCFNVSWAETFSQEGQSGCGASRLAINGFYRGENTTLDPISGVEEVQCCLWDAEYTKDQTVVVQADWKILLERDDQWVRCPSGFFLEGLYRTGNNESTLETIDAGHCVKPSSHPYHYGECYNEDISESFDEEGFSSCRDGFFVTGFFRGPCPELHCLEKLRCCQMSSEPIIMESLETVKIRIMEDTLVDISYLAHYLGYGNAGGCQSGKVGQDFRRNGDTWEAVTGEKCTGSGSENAFSIEYRDWDFGVKDIVFSDPIVEDITPEVVDSATIYNKDSVSSSHSIRRTEQSVTTVSNTMTSSWSSSHEVGVETTAEARVETEVNAWFVSAKASFGLSTTASYKYNTASEQTSENSNSNEQARSFEIESSKEIPPNSSAKWYLVLSKSRMTISYTTTVLVHFSVRLRGLLRSGEGYYGATTNFNYHYRGKRLSDYSYQFGDSNKPFYAVLKKESERNTRPWLWSDMQANYNYLPEEVINDLIDEDRYVFFLEGKFEVVSGNNVVINWEDVITGNEKNETSACTCKENENSALDENETTTRPTEENETTTSPTGNGQSGNGNGQSGNGNGQSGNGNGQSGNGNGQSSNGNGQSGNGNGQSGKLEGLGKRKKRDVGRSKRESVGGNDDNDNDGSESNNGSTGKKEGGNSNSKGGSNISRSTGSGDNTRNNVIMYPNEKTLVHAARVLPGDPPPVFPPPPPVNITKKPKKEREPLAILGN